MLQEVDQMLRSKNHARAVCLFHYIELVPLILPLPPIENLCLATFTDAASNNATNSVSSSSSGGQVSTGAADESGDKKKKKKGNNDTEVVYNLSPSDSAFIQQSTRDFHSYGCCASLIHAILEKSAHSISSGTGGVGTVQSTGSLKAGEGDLETPEQRSFMKICDHMKGFLFHFFRDLPECQSEETGKILRYVHSVLTHFILTKVSSILSFYLKAFSYLFLSLFFISYRN